MMRVVMTFFWGLLGAWVLTGDLEAQIPVRQNPPKIKVTNNTLTVTGYGLDAEAAKRDALKEAQKKLKEDLRGRKFQYWIPSEGFIQKNLLDGPGDEGDEVQVRDGEQAKTWILKVRQPSSTDTHRMEALARAHVEKQLRLSSISPRLHILTKGLAAVLVLLFALVGYLRLEEKTQGIYTHLLRVGVICLVVGAGVGILYFS